MTGLKEIDGKYYHECGAAMLPTDKKAAVHITHGVMKDSSTYEKLNPKYISDKITVPFNLYITSNEEIKEGDWCVNSYDNQIWEYSKIPCPLPYWGNKNTLTKIIASTNASLELPKLSQDFIKVYIEEYNKGNIIDKVLVEYEKQYFIANRYYSESDLDKEEQIKCQNRIKIFIKTNSSNEISIKKLKDSWNREEMRYIAIRFAHECRLKGVITNNDTIVLFDKWIKNNL